MHAGYSVSIPRSVGCWHEWASKPRASAGSGGTGYDSGAEIVEGVSRGAGG